MKKTRANIINYGRFHINYEAQLSREKNDKLRDNPQIIFMY
jgi:hypothetical protein